MKNYWKDFFEKYRQVDVKSDQDLYFQVGKSVGGKPISEEQFKKLVNEIEETLIISKEDYLLDLCCGNGVITYDIANKCKGAIGIDFSGPFIENAKKYKSSLNVRYYCDDALNFNKYLDGQTPNKILMHGSLAYLTQQQFDELLSRLVKNIPVKFHFLISNVPDAALKWNYYNTIKRKWEYIWHSVILGKDKGIGNWWYKTDIEKLARKNGLSVKFIDMKNGHTVTNYRLSMVISN